MKLPQMTKPVAREHYKSLYEAQKKTSRFIIGYGVTTTLLLGVFAYGSHLRYYTLETTHNFQQAKQKSIELIANEWAKESDYYQNLYNEATITAKMAKLSNKAKAHMKQNPVVAQKIQSKFGSDWVEATELYSRESSLNPLAINPSSGACGIVQALPCSKLVNNCALSDVDCQLDWGAKYIKNRYGSSSKALAFHDEKGWY